MLFDCTQQLLSTYIESERANIGRSMGIKTCCLRLFEFDQEMEDKTGNAAACIAFCCRSREKVVIVVHFLECADQTIFDPFCNTEDLLPFTVTRCEEGVAQE